MYFSQWIVNEMWNMYTMKHYSALKKMEIINLNLCKCMHREIGPIEWDYTVTCSVSLRDQKNNIFNLLNWHYNCQKVPDILIILGSFPKALKGNEVSVISSLRWECPYGPVRRHELLHTLVHDSFRSWKPHLGGFFNKVSHTFLLTHKSYLYGII